MALLEEVAKLNTLVGPMFGSSLVNGSSEKGKDRLFDEHLDFLLQPELANHGVFRSVTLRALAYIFSE